MVLESQAKRQHLLNETFGIQHIRIKIFGENEKLNE